MFVGIGKTKFTEYNYNDTNIRGLIFNYNVISNYFFIRHIV